MIAVDWGTSSFRAFRVRDGQVLARRETPHGILHVGSDEFAPTLRRVVGPWLEAGETQILMAGMVGSRQGWLEVPYLPCPAGVGELAAALTAVPFEGAAVRIVPGLRSVDANGVPEVMRGEETQIAALLPTLDLAIACLPGSHSKWVEIAEERITGLTTHMTGEAFAALRQHTILARTMAEGETHTDAFRRGVVRSAEQGGLLHHLFGVRTQALFGELPETEAASYLSGLLVGHEVVAMAPVGKVHLIGTPALCSLYALAISYYGAEPVVAPADAAALGLIEIAERAKWT